MGSWSGSGDAVPVQETSDPPCDPSVSLKATPASTLAARAHHKRRVLKRRLFKKEASISGNQRRNGSLIARAPLPLLCEESCRPRPQMAIAGVSLARANCWQVLELDSLAWSTQTRCKWALWGPWDSSAFLTLPLVPNWLPKLKPALIYPARLQYPSKLYVRKMPFKSINGRSKQHVGFFSPPQLAESSFLWDRSLF